MTTHGLGPTRAKVLETLQKSHTPMTATDVADTLGLHPNSARHHLGALFDAGYAIRTNLPPHGTGRPRVGFSPTQQAPTVNNDHLIRFTSGVLQHFFATNVEGAQAVGRTIAEIMGVPKPTAEVLDYLEEAGFAPQVDGDELQLTRCPYRRAFPEENMPAVCEAHKGFLAAAFMDRELGELQAGPTLCTVRISGLGPDPDVAPEFRTQSR